MVKVNLGGCSSFVKDADYKAYVEKAIAALEVLENETGKGNDFLGWKHLPSETLNSSLVAECEAVRDAWKAKNVDLVVVIGTVSNVLVHAHTIRTHRNCQDIFASFSSHT